MSSEKSQGVAPAVTVDSGKQRSFKRCAKRSMSEKEPLLPTKHSFCNCCRSMGHFLCGVERVKRL